MKKLLFLLIILALASPAFAQFGGGAFGGGGTTINSIGDISDVTITSAAEGELIYHNGTAWVDLSVGTSGQFLQTQGSGAPPQWATPSGSGDITAVGTCTSGDAFVDGGSDCSIVGEGATDDVNETTLQFADPTTDSTITFPTGKTGDFAVTTGALTSGNLVEFDGSGRLIDTGIATPAGGIGDVSGPGSSTDNAIMRYDGTGGSTAQNSGVTIDDSNNIVTAGTVTADGFVSTGTGITEIKTDFEVENAAGTDNILFVDKSANTATLKNAWDASAASFEIPNGASPTVDATGEIAIDTTSDQIQYYGSASARAISPLIPISKAFESPADADSFLLFRAPYGMTLSAIECIVDPADTGESVVIDIQECNSTGDSCATVDATITCDNDGASDDGTFTNGVIDAGDWVLLDIGTVTGTVKWLTFNIDHYINTD